MELPKIFRSRRFVQQSNKIQEAAAVLASQRLHHVVVSEDSRQTALQVKDYFTEIELDWEVPIDTIATFVQLNSDYKKHVFD